ncbi:uncharacterized protein LOC135340017 [Halichondria panicea]|uniref:uncharacterized protein LOC135340017 n=1 Tax=Halichondria panicea TaxID=6063 RepID=UPI00312B3076
MRCIAMILVPLFPLHKPISFLPQTKLVQIGKLRGEEAIICIHYQEVQQPRWIKLAKERLRMIEAKDIFTKCRTKELNKRWPKWDEATLDNYKLQFRIIDLNEDGLIDFKELCFALDVAGDKSSIEERRQYLKEVDTDVIVGVDLEEFLMLIDKVQAKSHSGFGNIFLDSGTGVLDIIRIGQFTVSQQIKHGLF